MKYRLEYEARAWSVSGAGLPQTRVHAFEAKDDKEAFGKVVDFFTIDLSNEQFSGSSNLEFKFERLVRVKVEEIIEEVKDVPSDVNFSISSPAERSTFA